MKPTARAWPLLAVAGVASLLLALAVGSVPVSPSQLLATLARVLGNLPMARA